MSTTTTTTSSPQSPPNQKKRVLFAMEARKNNFQKLEELMQRRKQCFAIHHPTILTFIETTKEEDLKTYNEQHWNSFAKMITLYFGRTFKSDKAKLSWNKACEFMLRSVLCRRSITFSDTKIVFVYEMANHFECFEESQPRYRCTFCNYFDVKMKTCSGCHRWPYCSTACQNKDWPSHQSVCLEINAQQNKEND